MMRLRHPGKRCLTKQRVCRVKAHLTEGRARVPQGLIHDSLETGHRAADDKSIGRCAGISVVEADEFIDLAVDRPCNASEPRGAVWSAQTHVTATAGPEAVAGI